MLNNLSASNLNVTNTSNPKQNIPTKAIAVAQAMVFVKSFMTDNQKSNILLREGLRGLSILTLLYNLI